MTKQCYFCGKNHEGDSEFCSKDCKDQHVMQTEDEEFELNNTDPRAAHYKQGHFNKELSREDLEKYASSEEIEILKEDIRDIGLKLGSKTYHPLEVFKSKKKIKQGWTGIDKNNRIDLEWGPKLYPGGKFIFKIKDKPESPYGYAVANIGHSKFFARDPNNSIKLPIPTGEESKRWWKSPQNIPADAINWDNPIDKDPELGFYEISIKGSDTKIPITKYAYKSLMDRKKFDDMRRKNIKKKSEENARLSAKKDKDFFESKEVKNMKLTKEDIQKYGKEDELAILEKYKKPDGYADAVGRKKKKSPKTVGDKSKYASEWERGKAELSDRKKAKAEKKLEIDKAEQDLKVLKFGKKKKKVTKEDIEKYATDEEKKKLLEDFPGEDYYECQVCGKEISEDQADDMSDTCSEYCLWVFAKVHPDNWNAAKEMKP